MLDLGKAGEANNTTKPAGKKKRREKKNNFADSPNAPTQSPVNPLRLFPDAGFANSAVKFIDRVGDGDMDDDSDDDDAASDLTTGE